MEDSGPVVAERPRLGLTVRSPAAMPVRRLPGDESRLIRRLLTPVQRLRYSLIPGPVHGWARSLRRWRRGEAELRLLAELVDPHRTAVDVGANKGTYTWFLAQLCRHVYAYEPNPALRWMLTRCTPRNVTIFPRAVSNQSGEQFLRIPLRNGHYANNVGTLRSAFDGDPCEVVPVTCSRLDDDGLMDVGFLKIDVEGHEREVLEGARELILRDRPVLLVEILPHHTGRPVEETIDELEQLGYRAHVARAGELVRWNSESSGSRSATESPTRNFIFLPTAETAAPAWPRRASA